MLISWVPSRKGGRAERDYLAQGGREVEFEAGPGLRHEAVLEDRGRNATGVVRVEVLGTRVSATRLPTGGGNAFLFSPMTYPVSFSGELDPAAGLVRGLWATEMQRRWNRVALPTAVVVALVVGVVVGLVSSWWVGVVVLIVLGALLLRVARMSDKRLATIVHRDLRRMARLIAGKG